MASFDELKERYHQIIDSGEYQFSPPQDISNLKTMLDGEVQSTGQALPAGLDLPDTVDLRDMYVGIYRPIADEVLVKYGTLGFKIPTICVGPINDGSLNATVRSMFGDGAIVLVNAGLDNFYYQCFKILANSCFSNSPNYTRDQTSSFLRNVLSASTRDDPRIADRLPLTEACYMALSVELHKSTEQFVIAHEVAHLTEDAVCCMSLVDLELRADRLGMAIVIETFLEKCRNSISGDELLRTRAAAVAPLIMFEFLFLRNVYHSILKGPNQILYREHPPELQRRDALIAFLVEKEVWPLLQKYYEEMSTILSNSYSDILDEIEGSSGFRRAMITYRFEAAVNDAAEPIPSSSVSYKIRKNTLH